MNLSTVAGSSGSMYLQNAMTSSEEEHVSRKERATAFVVAKGGFSTDVRPLCCWIPGCYGAQQRYRCAVELPFVEEAEQDVQCFARCPRNVI